jgi:hypothetical protein
MFDQMSFWDTPNVTSLPESADGLLPFGSQDGQTTSRCGREVAHARPSRQPGRKNHVLTAAEKVIYATLANPDISSASIADVLATPTVDTCGLSFPGSSKSVALERFSGSRLREIMGGYGSPEYVLTWKAWDMAYGPATCALRASVRRISVSDCSGWATPAARDYKSESATTEFNAKRDSHSLGKPLSYQAEIAGWPTVTATDAIKQGRVSPRKGAMGLSETVGAIQSGFPAVTVSKGGLNPALARWLMGYPEEWCQAAIKAWRLMPTKRQKPVG